jgi:hypothetical protein
MNPNPHPNPFESAPECITRKFTYTQLATDTGMEGLFVLYDNH